MQSSSRVPFTGFDALRQELHFKRACNRIVPHKLNSDNTRRVIVPDNVFQAQTRGDEFFYFFVIIKRRTSI